MTTASDTRAEASARLAGDDIEVIRDEPRPRDLRGLVLLAFVVVVGIAMWRHEMWRDELQAWMIARASHSVPNLLDNIRYEGHPALWYLLLLPLTKISGSPWVMQVAQLAIATGGLALVLWKAPFTRLQKVLFAGGYFVLFEYGTLSRSYSLGWLWLAATCVVASGKRRWPWAGVTLALLALTSAFGALVAVGVLVGLLVDEVVRHRESEGATPFVPLVLGGIVAAAGFAVAYAQAAPPGDAGVYRSWNTSFNSSLVRTSLAAVSRALVPIPKFRREFWNTSVFDGITTPAAILGVAFVVGIAWLLRRKPGAIAMWLAGVGLVVGFLYSKIQYASASRHYGHVFLVLIAALWLAPSMASWRGRDDADERPARTRSK